jgi:hypothetical protein
MKVEWHKATTFLSQAADTDRDQFHLKQARQRIHSYLEHFICVNHLGSTTAGSDCGDNIDTPLASGPPGPTDWNTFVASLRKHCSQPGTLDTNGRYFKHYSPQNSSPITSRCVNGYSSAGVLVRKYMYIGMEESHARSVPYQGRIEPPLTILKLLVTTGYK